MNRLFHFFFLVVFSVAFAGGIGAGIGTFQTQAFAEEPMPSTLTGANVIEGVRLENGHIILMGKPGTTLREEGQFPLSDPPRQVIDIQNSRLERRALIGVLENNTAFGSSRCGNIKRIRVGQFDEDTVRLVVEPECIQGRVPALYSHYNGPEQSVLQLQLEQTSAQTPWTASGNPNTAPAPISNNPPSGGSSNIPPLPNTTPPGTPNHIIPSQMSAVQPPSELQAIQLATLENGDPIVRLNTSGPVGYTIEYADLTSNQWQNGPRGPNEIWINLPNLQANPGILNFNQTQFPTVHQIEIRPLPNVPVGSRLVVQLKRNIQMVAGQITQNGQLLDFTVTTDPGSIANISDDSVLSPVPEELTDNKAPFAARIVIDAGHGGKDKGANRNGVLEKDLNLNLALRLKTILENKGFKVHMTRTTDVFLELSQITAITNRIHPDVFVSVHTNSSTNPAIHGLETYYYTRQSVPLAQHVHSQMTKRVNSPDRGVRRAMFYVIHHTSVPAILVETGYISNSWEREQLQDSQRNDATVKGIAEGIVNYLKWKKSSGN